MEFPDFMENFFSKNVFYLRKLKGLNQAQMAEILGKKKSIIGPYEKGEIEPAISSLQRLSKFFGISISDLIGIDLEKVGIGGDRQIANLSANPNANLSDKKGNLFSSKHEPPQALLDTSGHRVVPIVDIRAAAGEGYLNMERLEETDVFRLPQGLVKGKNPLCIRIKGPSMAPTLNDGGYVIITLLDKSEWLNMRNGFIYVVVDTEGKTYIKRVKNRFSGQKEGFIVLTSDNPDKQSHPNFNLHPHEIAFIWFVELYFTHKMPNIHDQYYTRLENLEDQFHEMQDRFLKLEARSK